MTVTHRRLALATVVSVALVLSALLPGNWQAAAAPAPNPLKPYVAASKLYALFKPADWSVIEEPQPNSFRVLVQAPNALALVVAYKRTLGLKYGEAVLSEAFVSPDASRATARVRTRAASHVVSGKYYFKSRRGGCSASGRRRRHARGGSEVAEALPGNRHELPVVAAGLQGQSQHTPRAVLEDFAVRLGTGAIV